MDTLIQQQTGRIITLASRAVDTAVASGGSAARDLIDAERDQVVRESARLAARREYQLLAYYLRKVHHLGGEDRLAAIRVMPRQIQPRVTRAIQIRQNGSAVGL